LGNVHYVTLCTIKTFADALNGHGKIAQAIAAYNEVLAVHKAVLGEEHPTTIKVAKALEQTLQSAACGSGGKAGSGAHKPIVAAAGSGSAAGDGCTSDGTDSVTSGGGTGTDTSGTDTSGGGIGTDTSGNGSDACSASSARGFIESASKRQKVAGAKASSSCA
jgi:hypothetical protein